MKYLEAGRMGNRKKKELQAQCPKEREKCRVYTEGR
jgi:hypothetical protein